MEDQISSLFLNHSIKKLQQMAGHIELCLGRLSEEQVWQRNGGHENAIGHLILHLCGNARQWIGHGVGGDADVRNRPAEFSPESLPSKQELAALLRSTIEQSVKHLGTVSPARLAERIKPQDVEVSVLEAIYQVVGHFQQHTGQIIFAAKQMAGEGLGIYQPPAATGR